MTTMDHIFWLVAGVALGCVLMDIMKEILSLCSANIRYWIPRAIIFFIFVADILIFGKYGV
jgi:hypothetical protein